MTLKSMARALALAGAVLALCPVAAQAASRVRVEAVQLQVNDPVQDLRLPSVRSVFGVEPIDVSGSSVQSSAAAFGGDARGYERVSVISGAVVAVWGDDPTATETTGLRLQAGQETYIPLRAGQKIAFIEAVDAPAAASVAGTVACSNCSTASGQSTANTSLGHVDTATADLDANLGAKADSAASSDSGTFSAIALIKRLLGKVTTQVPAALTSGGGLKTALDGVDDGLAFSGSISGTGTLATLNANGYGHALVQFTAVGSSVTFQPQPSTDGTAGTGTTFASGSQVFDLSNPSGAASASLTPTTGRVYCIPTAGPTLKLGLTAGTGTTSMVGALHRGACPIPNAQTIVGNASHQTTDSGAPIKTAGKVNTSGTSCTDGQRCDSQSAENGGAITRPFALGAMTWSYTAGTAGLTTTSDTAAHASCGAGLRNYVTGIQVQNAAAVAHTLTIKDGSTVLWAGQLAASIGDGRSVAFDIPLRGTAATALNVASSTTDQTLVNLQGFCAP